MNSRQFGSGAACRGVWIIGHPCAAGAVADNAFSEAVLHANLGVVHGEGKHSRRSFGLLFIDGLLNCDSETSCRVALGRNGEHPNIPT